MDRDNKDPESKSEDQKGNITTGDIQGTGIAVGHGAKAIVQQYASTGTAIADSFRPIYEQIDKREEDSDVPKAEIAETVKKIENEVASQDPNPNKVERWLKFLASMAPDIFDVTAATLVSPIAGVAEVIRKISQKAREDYSAS